MTSIIGYIRKGKKVRVGEVAKNKGRILPIVVNGRVAYITISDLNISTDIKTLQTVTERITDKMSRKTVAKRISLYSGLFSGTLTDKNFKSGSNASKLFSGIGATGYHRDLMKKSTYKISFEIMKNEEKDIKFSYTSLPVSFMFHQIENKGHHFDFFAGIILMPFVELNIEDDIILNGQGLGFTLDIEFVKNLSDNFLFHIEANFQLAQMFNFGSDTNTEVVDEITNELTGYIYGPKLLAKLSFEY
jgi:hypothetical protein